MNEEIRVLDHGFVCLDDFMADDLSVVNAARVSFAVRSDYENGELNAADKGLIKFLMRERHGTPFEHNSFRFIIKAPIGVAREWMRHRVSSFNEMSTRYKELDNPDFYIPEIWRTQVGKPGSYTFEIWKGNTEKIQSLTLRHYQDCLDLYKYKISAGIAKEQARNDLPLAMYTEYYYTTNARSLMNFLS